MVEADKLRTYNTGLEVFVRVQSVFAQGYVRSSTTWRLTMYFKEYLQLLRRLIIICWGANDCVKDGRTPAQEHVISVYRECTVS